MYTYTFYLCSKLVFQQKMPLLHSCDRPRATTPPGTNARPCLAQRFALTLASPLSLAAWMKWPWIMGNPCRSWLRIDDSWSGRYCMHIPGYTISTVVDSWWSQIWFINMELSIVGANSNDGQCTWLILVHDGLYNFVWQTLWMVSNGHDWLITVNKVEGSTISWFNYFCNYLPVGKLFAIREMDIAHNKLDTTDWSLIVFDCFDWRNPLSCLSGRLSNSFLATVVMVHAAIWK